MILGVVLIVGSMAAGGLALAAADHTVSYWATRGSVQEGDRVKRSDFVAVKAKVPDRTARTLLRTEAELPNRLSRMVWAESMGGGTLISRQHLTGRRNMVEVPITVGPSGAPTDLRRGDLVDVWAATGDRNAPTPAKATKVLSRARVLESANGGSMDGTPGTTVVVDARGVAVDGKLVAAVSTGRVTLVRVS